MDLFLAENLIKLGMAVLVGGIIGAGELVFGGISTATVLIILFLFPYLEGRVDGIREARTYKIVVPAAKGRSFEKSTSY
jgi:hypothetical protein